jgi:hypothetical protein
MEREKLICDKRCGCVAIYKLSRKDDTNGCHLEDDRNIAYSSKDAKFNESCWTMDEEIKSIFEEMVNAYNEKYNLK